MISDPGLAHDIPAPEGDRLASVVVNACRLVSASDPAIVRSVTVISGRRLTGVELLRVRAEAARQCVCLAMDGSGAVSVRRERAVSGEAAEPADVLETADRERRASAAQPARPRWRWTQRWRRV